MSDNSRLKTLSAASFDAVIALMTVGSWLWMLLFTRDEAFASLGIESLKYYTVLSNLFVGFVCAACAIIRFNGKSTDLSVPLQFLKLSSTSCVLITFTVVMVFLGPVFGFDLMFRKFNLIFHLIAPVFASLSYLIFERRGRVSFRFSLLGLIPTVLYGFVYMINVIVNGAKGNDFYYFAYWGIPVGLLFFAGILGLNSAYLQLLRRFSRK